MEKTESSPHSARPHTVVLTGGIASGKTTVSDCFSKLGVPVVDTDLIARELTEAGQPALESICEKLGRDFLMPDGSLDRAKLRTAIFEDRAVRSQLEAILHPAIAARAEEQIGQLHSTYCIVVIPLFAETSDYDWVDRVLVVDVPEETQVSRVMSRDRVSREQAAAVLRAQASRRQRLMIADDVIDNGRGLDFLQHQVEDLHRKYLRLFA